MTSSSLHCVEGEFSSQHRSSFSPMRKLFSIGPYTITELIYDSKKTRVFRSVRGTSSSALDKLTTYIIKTVKSDSPTVEELARLRHEYTILKDLHIAGVIEAVGLESFGSGTSTLCSFCLCYFSHPILLS